MSGWIMCIEYKPAASKSDFTMTGLYIYDNGVFDVIETMKPSGRGEFEWKRKYPSQKHIIVCKKMTKLLITQIKNDHQ